MTRTATTTRHHWLVTVAACKLLSGCMLGSALASGNAWGQTACAINPFETPGEPLASLLDNVTTCENNADWLLYLGERLLQEKRFTDAAEHLERALLLQPNSIPTALAYSVALAGSGDLTSALLLLQEVSRSADVDPHLREQLTAVQERLLNARLTATNPMAASWQHRVSAGLRLGYDSNLLGTAKLNSLTLTLPGGDLNLPVEPSNLPRPGAYQRADLRTDHTYHHTGGRRTAISTALLQRNSNVAPDTNTTQAELVLENSPGPETTLNKGLPFWTMASVAGLHTQTGTRYLTTGLGIGWQGNLSGCTQKVGTEWQRRSLQSNSVLSGHYKGVTGSWSCYAPTQRNSFWQISTRLGTDTPTNPLRPGGAQHQFGVRGTAWVNNWLADLDIQRTLDNSGYSPILNNNAIRHTSRLTLRVEHHFPLPQWGSDLHAIVGAEAFWQRANLSLFKINSTSFYVTLRKGW